MDIMAAHFELWNLCGHTLLGVTVKVGQTYPECEGTIYGLGLALNEKEN